MCERARVYVRVCVCTSERVRVCMRVLNDSRRRASKCCWTKHVLAHPSHTHPHAHLLRLVALRGVPQVGLLQVLPALQQAAHKAERDV
jgi:hypothetical protein